MAGDSGSWVIVTPTYRVAGVVVARSPGRAYLVLLSQRLQRIRESNPDHSGLVTLPHPVLAHIALANLTSSDVAKDVISILFSLLREGSLSTDPIVRTMQMALYYWERRDAKRLADFADIIRLYGSDIQLFLEQSPTVPPLPPRLYYMN